MHAAKRRAFTLIELLIVIAIIAILATIILISVSNSNLKAQTSVAKNTLQTFKKSLMLYQNEVGSFPNYTARPSYWCHPGYSNGTDGICMEQLKPTYLSDFQMQGPYGKCDAYDDSYSLCYNYYVYNRSVLLTTRLNPIDTSGPTNIPNFPSLPTGDYCDPNRSGGSVYYCDGYTY